MTTTKTLSIEPARWQVGDEGELYAPLYDAVYANLSGVWGRAQSVFVEGCELPSRWQSDRCIRLLETGFGLGINFLTTWASIKASDSIARLQYVAIEKHPFTAQDLRSALQASVATAPASITPVLEGLVEGLIAQWPPLIPGFHSLLLDDQTSLTLVFGDVDSVLPSIHGRFDAFYLDGFAPDRNPAMWSLQTMQHLARLAADGAIASSGCGEDSVKRTLQSVGFEVSKRECFGEKPESLSAKCTEKFLDSATRVESVVVIGAGIAGASIARQLATRGISVTLIERDQPASGASGNPVAVVRPEPGGATNVIAEFSAAGVGWLQRWLTTHGKSVPHDFCGAVRLLRDQRRHDKLAAYAQTVPDEWLHEVSVSEATMLCGQSVATEGFFLPHAGWVDPTALIAALIDHPLIKLKSGTEVKQLSPNATEGWCVELANHEKIFSRYVALATAFADLSSSVDGVDSARGQLSVVAERDDKSLRAIVCRDGYVTPAINGVHTIGATIQIDDDAKPRSEDDLENFHRLQRLLPDFVSDANELRSGRVSWRATTQDRLPLVGKIAEGLYASIGHGSRGVACAPWCAEFLVTQMLDEPLPIGSEWIERLHPLRFSKQLNQKT
jgi:tRNA 5-methylaminomethyl-2-thiouridine biosynthesis bifunctional protein